MIGPMPTGRIAGVDITATPHGGLSATVHGRPARIALVDDDGHVLAAGKDLADEVEGVAVNAYRQVLTGHGALMGMDG